MLNIPSSTKEETKVDGMRARPLPSLPTSHVPRGTYSGFLQAALYGLAQVLLVESQHLLENYQLSKSAVLLQFIYFATALKCHTRDRYGSMWECGIN